MRTAFALVVVLALAVVATDAAASHARSVGWTVEDTRLVWRGQEQLRIVAETQDEVDSLYLALGAGEAPRLNLTGRMALLLVDPTPMGYCPQAPTITAVTTQEIPTRLTQVEESIVRPAVLCEPPNPGALTLATTEHLPGIVTFGPEGAFGVAWGADLAR